MFSKTQVELSSAAGRVSAIKAQFEKLENSGETTTTVSPAGAPSHKNIIVRSNNNNYYNAKRSSIAASTTTSQHSNNNNKSNKNIICQVRSNPVCSLSVVPMMRTYRLPRSATSLDLQRPQQQLFAHRQQHTMRQSLQLTGRSTAALTESPTESKTISLTLDKTKLPLHFVNSNACATSTSPAAVATLLPLTRDAVKRNSIKRSPAFRVGDKQNNAVLLKQVSAAAAAAAVICSTAGRISEQQKTTTFANVSVPTINTTKIMPSNLCATSCSSSNETTPAVTTQLLNNFLAQRCADQLEQMQQPGMTDSIRAALLRPLPSGPPPKKPPRISEILSAAKTKSGYNSE